MGKGLNKIENEFGEKLREKILKSGESLTDFAKNNDINLRSLHSWLSGNRSPRLDQLYIIGQNFSIDILLFGRHLPAFPFFAQNISKSTAKILNDAYSTLLKYLNLIPLKKNPGIIYSILEEKASLPFLVESFDIVYLFIESLWHGYSVFFFGKAEEAPLKALATFLELADMKTKVISKIEELVGLKIQALTFEPEDIHKLLADFEKDVYERLGILKYDSFYFSFSPLFIFKELNREKDILFSFEGLRILEEFSMAIERKELPLLCPLHFCFYYGNCHKCGGKNE